MSVRLGIIILFSFAISACNDTESLDIDHLPECIQMAITESTQHGVTEGVGSYQDIHTVRELSTGGITKYLTLAGLQQFDHNIVLTDGCEEICSYNSHSTTALECLTNFDWNESQIIWTK